MSGLRKLQCDNCGGIIDGVTLTIKKRGVASLDLRPTITSGKLKSLLEIREL